MTTKAAALKTKCQGCRASIELGALEPPKNKPGAKRWRGTCAKCGTEMTVTTSEENAASRKDVDWHREPEPETEERDEKS